MLCRLKEAAELKAKQEAEEEAAKEAEMARKDAAAVAAASPGGAPPQPQQPTAEAQSPAERKGRKAPHRRGRQPKPPPPPSDLDYVRAAVARDPARYSEVRKTQQQWEFRLSARDLQVGAGRVSSHDAGRAQCTWALGPVPPAQVLPSLCLVLVRPRCCLSTSARGNPHACRAYSSTAGAT